MRRNVLKDNRGLTLVEMLVSFAILGVIMVAAVSFMSSMSKMYQKSNAEVVVQNEVQTLMNQLEDYIVDADLGVKLVGNKLYILKSDGFSVITYDSSAQELRYAEYTDDAILASASWDTVTKATAYTMAQVVETADYASGVTSDLLASYVSEFGVTDPDTTLSSSANYISISIQIEKDSEKYTANKNIYLRNQIVDDSSTSSTDSSTDSSEGSTEETTEESTVVGENDYTVTVTGPAGGSGQIKIYVICDEIDDSTDYCYVYFTLDSNGEYSSSGTFLNGGVYSGIYKYEVYSGSESAYTIEVSSP